jgi:LmbE family N-acetylglucosaminyl deacetylase
MTVLVIAPHPDDEVLGCGGTIAKRAAAGDDVWVCVVTEGKEPLYSKEFVRNEYEEMQNAHRILGVSHVITLGFPSAMLDTVPQYEINEELAAVVDAVKPDEVFIPHRGDIHRDHQIVADAAMVAMRPNNEHKVKRILAYETMSETDWNIPNVQNAFIPNVYEDISKYTVRKTDALMMYRSQVFEYPAARSMIGIQGLARHRGAVAGMEAAEAFMLIREVAE